MFNISRQTIWFIVILTTLISIYYIFFNDDKYSHNKNKYKYRYHNNVYENESIHENEPIYKNNIYRSNSNDDETSVPSRKKINKKHSRSKRIHISPNIQRDEQLKSIKSMTNKLRNRISKTKLNVVDKPAPKNTLDKPAPKNILDKPAPKYILKLFFADWCPHCTHFKPVWDKIKLKYKDKILFENVNCTDTNPGLDYVQGLPTIALYDHSNRYIENYENDGNPRNFDLFVQNLLK